MKVPTMKASMLWSVFKNLIGKDLSKFSLPVFINEPFTILQKAAEMVVFANHFLKLARKEEDPVKRLLYVSGYAAATYSFVKGRTAKPFNPLLGETFEVVTNEYRFLAE